MFDYVAEGKGRALTKVEKNNKDHKCSKKAVNYLILFTIFIFNFEPICD